MNTTISFLLSVTHHYMSFLVGLVFKWAFSRGDTVWPIIYQPILLWL